jgi:antitoxin CptB
MSEDARRKRLLWRATHRGTKEMDLVVGGFVRQNIDRIDEAGLKELEAIIELPDPELQSWLLGQKPVPEQHKSATLLRLLAFQP